MKKKKKSIYMGGEEDEEKVIMPKQFGKFFNKKILFVILIIVFLLLLQLCWSLKCQLKHFKKRYSREDLFSDNGFMKPLSIDLRQRIVQAYDAREGTKQQIAQRFAVSVGSGKKLKVQ